MHKRFERTCSLHVQRSQHLYHYKNIHSTISHKTAVVVIIIPDNLWSRQRGTRFVTHAFVSTQIYWTILNYAQKWMSVPTLYHNIFLSSVFLRTQRNAFYAMLDVYWMGDWLRTWFLLLSIRSRRGILGFLINLYFTLKKTLSELRWEQSFLPTSDPCFLGNL
jgi:hypothetical protein